MDDLLREGWGVFRGEDLGGGLSWLCLGGGNGLRSRCDSLSCVWIVVCSCHWDGAGRGFFLGFPCWAPTPSRSCFVVYDSCYIQHC